MDAKKKTERDERYLHFLMELYMLFSKQYVSYNMSHLLKRHTINPHVISTLTSRGWLKINRVKAGRPLYHWLSSLAPLPDLSIAETICDETLKKASREKALKRQMENHPVSQAIKNKKLIPISMTLPESQKVNIPGVLSQGTRKEIAINKIYRGLLSLPGALKANPTMVVGSFLKERDIDKTILTIINKKGWLVKSELINMTVSNTNAVVGVSHEKVSGYLWKGPAPISMTQAADLYAELFHYKVGQYKESKAETNEPKFTPVETKEKLLHSDVSESELFRNKQNKKIQKALELLPAMIQSNPYINLGEFLKNNSLDKKTSIALKNLGWLTAEGSPRHGIQYTWIGPLFIGYSGADKVRKAVTEYKRNLPCRTQNTKVENIQQHPIAKSPVTLNVPQDKTLKLEIAKRLYSLGDLEAANNILKEIE